MTQSKCSIRENCGVLLKPMDATGAVYELGNGDSKKDCIATVTAFNLDDPLKPIIIDSQTFEIPPGVRIELEINLDGIRHLTVFVEKDNRNCIGNLFFVDNDENPLGYVVLASDFIKLK
ncbi:hypothetical protein WAK64_19900 [Bacillus spongiae]|uniref:Nucleoplasmin-like domain-containing protein n=1 Tax=Bacillus spongiae TaxID=2683610 RepID=A0ABU8HJ55_9BACI